MLVAGTLWKQRSEGVDLAWNLFRPETRREAAIEKSGSRVKRPVEAVRKRGECLVFRSKARAQVYDVEPRPGRELERQIERLDGHMTMTA